MDLTQDLVTLSYREGREEVGCEHERWGSQHWPQACVEVGASRKAHVQKASPNEPQSTGHICPRPEETKEHRQARPPRL